METRIHSSVDLYKLPDNFASGNLAVTVFHFSCENIKKFKKIFSSIVISILCTITIFIFIFITVIVNYLFINLIPFIIIIIIKNNIMNSLIFTYIILISLLTLSISYKFNKILIRKSSIVSLKSSLPEIGIIKG